MIYRILANAKKGSWDKSRQKFVSWPAGPLRGAWTAGLEGMAVKYPELENRRVRFFFTEKRLERSWPSDCRTRDPGRACRSRYPAEEPGKVADLLPRPRPGGDSARVSQAVPKIVC
jgi:hypothetical protein